MSMNIFVKKNPEWRPLQQFLSVFKTKYKGGKFNKSASVESQFSKEDLERIHNAIHHTKMIQPDIATNALDIVDEVPSNVATNPSTNSN